MDNLGIPPLFDNGSDIFDLLWSPSSWLLTTAMTIAFFSISTFLFGYVVSTSWTSKLSSATVNASATARKVAPLHNKEGIQQQQRIFDVRQLVSAGGAHVWWHAIDRASSDVSDSQCSLDSENKRFFHRQTTSIGRFALRSQTQQNPCIITFFIAMANKKGEKEMTIEEFGEMWKERVMKKHERFCSRISKEDDRFYEVDNCYTMDNYATETQHPKEYHREFASRVNNYLTSYFDVYSRLWEVQLSTGPIGSSGAIRKELANKLRGEYDRETVALFRVHHSLCDGVSLSVAVGDACDEGEELQGKLTKELEKRKLKKKQRDIFQRVLDLISMAFFYLVGGIIALSLQFWRMMVGVNPFDDVIAASPLPGNLRSTSWMHLDDLTEIKKAAKSISSSTTLNDICVACLTAALNRQLKEHRLAMLEGASKKVLRIPSHLNITVPVHLTGGILLPGQTIGNKIGAFVPAIPMYGSSRANRLRAVSAALMLGKRTPAALIAWSLAKFSSMYAPLQVSKFFMRHGNAKSVAVISNIKGFPLQTHWKGKRMEHLSALLPLPPGIPTSFCVQSYNGEISFTVEADKRAIPDAVRFADWVVEEYKSLKEEASSLRCD